MVRGPVKDTADAAFERAAFGGWGGREAAEESAWSDEHIRGPGSGRDENICLQHYGAETSRAVETGRPSTAPSRPLQSSSHGGRPVARAAARLGGRSGGRSGGHARRTCYLGGTGQRRVHSALRPAPPSNPLALRLVSVLRLAFLLPRCSVRIRGACASWVATCWRRTAASRTCHRLWTSRTRPSSPTAAPPRASLSTPPPTM